MPDAVLHTLQKVRHLLTDEISSQFIFSLHFVQITVDDHSTQTPATASHKISATTTTSSSPPPAYSLSSVGPTNSHDACATLTRPDERWESQQIQEEEEPPKNSPRAADHTLFAACYFCIHTHTHNSLLILLLQLLLLCTWKHSHSNCYYTSTTTTTRMSVSYVHTQSTNFK